MPLVSVTRLRLRSWLYLPAFFLHSTRSANQAAAAPGNLAVRLLRDRGNAFWTMTAWSSDAEMKAFMHAGAHGAAMRKLLDWCDEAAVTHWTQDSASLPTWEEGHERLQREGRRAKVNHPSASQTAFVIPPPIVGPTRERRVK
jgi:heme-degrading monooxygenase HmoA